ncbi:MAG: hypothetical protein HY235_28465 [Acidobacteria bacterium]|nr:hypothetical protein [Acidobacteriota bacterium]
MRRRTGGQAFQTEAVRTRRITHSAIDRKLLKTRSGQLFSVRSIEQGQKFHGYITVADGLMDEIKQLWPEDKDLSLRLGRARSRGQGEVQLRWSEARADEVNIQVRVEEMQNKAAQLRERLTGKVVVSVTLQAPAIVRDDYLLFKTWLGPADVGLKEGWELLSWFSRPTLIGGWHEAAQVPRSEASGIAAGSCFLFGCEQDRTMIAQMAAWGEQLEASGIGERRIEGFGEVRCCHEIHAECAERL